MAEMVRFMQRGGRELELQERPPRGADVVLLRCDKGHAVGILNRTGPVSIFREGERFPSYVVVDGAFQGVTEVDGVPVLLGGDLPDAQLHCGSCGWTEQRLSVDTAVAAEWDTLMLFCHQPMVDDHEVPLDLRSTLPQGVDRPDLLDLRSLVSSITVTLN